MKQRYTYNRQTAARQQGRRVVTATDFEGRPVYTIYPTKWNWK